ncbi:MAG TPA: HAD family phosphatase [Planctomycetota bacterium]|jgi:beta-phosphoglucomutase-like phosphatase (HAD superfamily)
MGGPGIIFDQDETIALTGPMWRRAEELALKSVGHVWTAELAAKYKGMNAPDVAATAHRILKLDIPLAEFQRRMREALLEGFATLPIEEVPGAVALVRRLNGLAPMAVASGSPRPAIEKVLSRLGIGSFVPACVSSEEVPRGKPSPDVFLAAAKALAADPARCVVFEDSVIGAQAARAAGMRCIVRPSLKGACLVGLADLVVRHWDEVSAERVVEMIAGG